MKKHLFILAVLVLVVGKLHAQSTASILEDWGGCEEAGSLVEILD